MEHFKDYIALSRYRAEKSGLSTCYTMLDSFGRETRTINYLELDRKARALAAELQAQLAAGERVILLLNNGLDYLQAFFGCLYSGMIAVTLHPPTSAEQLLRLKHIIKDSGASCILTTSGIQRQLHEKVESMHALIKLNWMNVDDVSDSLADSWREPRVDRDTVAFLQYTSGSTGSPKGVVVSHGNLLFQGEYMKAGFGLTEQDVYVSWLPLFHDMGLILGALQPFYMGIPSYLMDSISFLKRPHIWLQTISKYGATITAAPNFAYDLCVENFKPEHYEGVDLSAWKVAVNAAEPVRNNTILKFSELFSKYGFHHDSFNPSYGLAETTLAVSSGERFRGPIVRKVDGGCFEKGDIVFSENAERTVEVVSSGKLWGGIDLKIVNPETKISLNTNKIGEIWVRGDTVAKGYWKKPHVTEETFKATVANKDAPNKHFVRTGDLGFIDADGYLYITSRVKDLIIIRGKNHAPNDIELSVLDCSEAIHRRHLAAFSVLEDKYEKLVVVAQLDARKSAGIDCKLLAKRINRQVMKDHAVKPHEILLIHKCSFPKTTSGKVRRQQCKQVYLADEFPVLFRFSHPHESSVAA